MGTSHCLPLFGELKIISMVEGEDGPIMVCGVGQLLFIRKPQVPGVACGEAIDPMRAQQGGYCQMHMFIKIEFHGVRRAEII